MFNLFSQFELSTRRLTQILNAASIVSAACDLMSEDPSYMIVAMTAADVMVHALSVLPPRDLGLNKTTFALVANIGGILAACGRAFPLTLASLTHAVVDGAAHVLNTFEIADAAAESRSLKTP
jgi:hypothetical protein